MNKLLLAFLLMPLVAPAQGPVTNPEKYTEFIPLYPAGTMPNSKGMKLTDSLYNERFWRVGTPGMYAFFPGAQENKGAAVLIIPGGGYDHISFVISGTQLAKWFNAIGISAFVLNYRLPTSPDLQQKEMGALQDAQRAIKLIRANAPKWGIKKDKIGVQGTSAGGHLAAMAATQTTDFSKVNDQLDTISFHPDFMILVSPVIDMTTPSGSRKNLLGDNPTKEMMEKFSPQLQVTSATSPAFIVHAFNDKGVNPKNSLMLYNALLDKNVGSSLHIFPLGGHAIALRNNPGSTEQWTTLCEAWLVEMNFIPQSLSK